ATKAAVWKANQWVGKRVVITSGTGAGQLRRITANDTTRLVLNAAWTTVPNATSTYLIAPVSTGNNTLTTFNDTTAAWFAHQWQGFTIRIATGTGSGQVVPILDNTPPQLMLAGQWQLTKVPDTTSTYRIENAVGPATIFASLDPDGLGPMPFGRPVLV